METLGSPAVRRQVKKEKKKKKKEKAKAAVETAVSWGCGRPRTRRPWVPERGRHCPLPRREDGMGPGFLASSAQLGFFVWWVGRLRSWGV